MTLGVLRERPTAIRSVPGAAGSVRASAPVQAGASAATEARRPLPLHEVEAAWKAGGHVERLFGETVAETCLCGGVISARNTDPAIAAGVRIHNSSTVHAQWAMAAGWR